MSNSYGLHETNECIKSLQRMLNELFDLDLKPDGNIGKITQEAIKNYQNSLGISEKDGQGVCYGEKTQAAAAVFIEAKYLDYADFVAAGKELGVETASVIAFAKTEAKEFGFLNNGYPVILFERHKFYQALVKKSGKAFANSIAASNPDICDDNSGGYQGGEREIKRIERAAAINEEAALASASWGMFQVMGFNYKMVGWASVSEFVKAMKESEKNHLKAFVNFIKADPELLPALKKKDWAEVARNYNGEAYHINKYDVKMAANYKLAKAQE